MLVVFPGGHGAWNATAMIAAVCLGWPALEALGRRVAGVGPPRAARAAALSPFIGVVVAVVVVFGVHGGVVGRAAPSRYEVVDASSPLLELQRVEGSGAERAHMTVTEFRDGTGRSPRAGAAVDVWHAGRPNWLTFDRQHDAGPLVGLAAFTFLVAGYSAWRVARARRLQHPAAPRPTTPVSWGHDPFGRTAPPPPVLVGAWDRTILASDQLDGTPKQNRWAPP